MRGVGCFQTPEPEQGPTPSDLELGRWIGATIVSLGLSVTVSLALGLVGLPAMSPLSLVVGAVCGTVLAGFLLEAKTVRRWAAVFGVVLLAELMLAFEVVGVVTVFGAR
jgi:hypothetical protein